MPTGRQLHAIGLATLILSCILAGCGGNASKATGLVHVETNPPGASIRVGPTQFGPSPTVISGIPQGDIYVIATLEGYRTGSEFVHVPDFGEIRIQIELEPLVGYLTVESTPTAAQVFLNGTTFLGHTPLRSARVPIGEHTYELRLENHETTEFPITIEEERRYTKLHDLKPLQSEILVVSRPSGAQIWLNERLREESTPAKFILPPGEYSIAVYAKGYVMGEELIQLQPNERRPVEIVLQEGQVPPGMVLIPAGEFIFGHQAAPAERPRKTVYLDAYYIDKFEVTNADFKKAFPSHSFEPGLEDFPVTGVTWVQANEFARRVGKRLPTEKEWEKAARGVDGREWPWGNTWDPKNVNAAVEFNPRIARIGSFRTGASPYSVMDMAGNAYEWVADWYDRYEGNTDVTTEYGMVFRVLRGGSYRSSQFDVRCAARHFDRPDSAREDYGFRCAMDVVEVTPQNRVQRPRNPVTDTP